MTKSKVNKGGRPRLTPKKKTALSKYLKSSQTRHGDFADEIECSESYVYGLADGRHTPGADLRIRIEDATDGAVGFRDW